MDGRWMILLALAAGSPTVQAVSKCQQPDGGLVYVQSRTCPAHLEPLHYDPPPLNRMSASVRSDARPVRKERKTRSKPDPLLPKCRKLKALFGDTNEACRGTRDCRARFHRRQALREKYQAAFCAVRTGAIDS